MITKITEDFISFETAKIAQEKGFLWEQSKLTKEGFVKFGEVFAESGYNLCYNKEGQTISPKMFNLNNSHFAKPTQALLAKWLRIKHEMNVWVDCDLNKRYTFYINLIPKGSYIEADDLKLERNWWKSYELALENGLMEALKLIKE